MRKVFIILSMACLIFEYLRLKEIEEDYNDYSSAIEIKKNNKNWTDHEELKRELKI